MHLLIVEDEREMARLIGHLPTWKVQRDCFHQEKSK
jgi:hypothetical protein